MKTIEDHRYRAWRIPLEAGANDGIKSEQTLATLRKVAAGPACWSNPFTQKFLDCVVNRNTKAIVEWGALVPPDWPGGRVEARRLRSDDGHPWILADQGR